VRIVALTLDPSLAAALNMLDEWEITTAHDIDAVVENARGAAIVLIGVGGTDEGIDVAHQIHSRGVTIPSLVVGEEPAPETATIPVLLRPFSLDDLLNAIDTAMEGVSAPNVSDAPAPAPEVEQPSFEPAEGEIDETQESSGEAVVVELRPSPLAPEPVEANDQAADPLIDETPQPAVTTPDAPVTPAPSAPVRPPPTPSRQEPVHSREPVTPLPPAVPLPAATHVAPVQEHRELRRRLGAHRRDPHDSPARQSKAVPAAYEAPSRRRGLSRRESRAAAPRDASAEESLVERLRAGLAATKDIEMLLDELPVVGDVTAMAEALLGEVAFAFSPQIASVYLHEGGLFRIIASRGLSRVEQGLEVDEEHPLFSQTLISSEPVLIAPVDLARGLVSGIGGAHTEAMMVGPIHVDGECIAVLVLGRPDFTDPDLDVIANLAREAGPGLALARALRALRDRSS
jgi:hypothetical protein